MDLIKFVTGLNEKYRFDCNKLNSESPWFGHFSLSVKGKKQSYKIGDVKQANMKIIDWRHPLANAYFDTPVGDEFDIDEYQTQTQTQSKHCYAPIVGKVMDKTGLTCSGYSIVKAQVTTEHNNQIVQLKGDAFVLIDDDKLAAPAVDGLPDIRSLLSSEQYKLITKSSDKPVIIQGQAGSGKTTVALYRLSWLMYPSEDRVPIDPNKVLIVMFNKALQSYIASALAPLNLQDANVFTFHAWALDKIKTAYNGQFSISNEKYIGAENADNIKKQIGILNALEKFVDLQEKNLFKWADSKLSQLGAKAWFEELCQSTLPIAQRLIYLRTKALNARNANAANSGSTKEQQRLEQIYILFSRAVKRMTLYKEECNYSALNIRISHRS